MASFFESLLLIGREIRQGRTWVGSEVSRGEGAVAPLVNLWAILLMVKPARRVDRSLRLAVQKNSGLFNR
jgi:hypothetical protein